MEDSWCNKPDGCCQEKCVCREQVQTRNLYWYQIQEWKIQQIVQECLNSSTEIVSIMKIMCRKISCGYRSWSSSCNACKSCGFPLSMSVSRFALRTAARKVGSACCVCFMAAVLKSSLFVYTTLLFLHPCFSPHITLFNAAFIQQLWSFYQAQCNRSGFATSIWSGALDFPWKSSSAINLSANRIEC